jgi:hypothetical protein
VSELRPSDAQRTNRSHQLAPINWPRSTGPDQLAPINWPRSTGPIQPAPMNWLRRTGSEDADRVMAAGARCCERRSAAQKAQVAGACRWRARRGIAPSTWGACGRRGRHLGALRSVAASAEHKVQSPRGEGASPDARLRSEPEARRTQRGGIGEALGGSSDAPSRDCAHRRSSAIGCSATPTRARRQQHWRQGRFCTVRGSLLGSLSPPHHLAPRMAPG